MSNNQLLADRINALEESATLAMSKKSREIAAQGHNVINLSVGEPDFKTPKHICEAAKKAIQELDGASVDGRTIGVSVAKPREDRGNGGGGNRGGGGGGFQRRGNNNYSNSRY